MSWGLARQGDHRSKVYDNIFDRASFALRGVRVRGWIY